MNRKRMLFMPLMLSLAILACNLQAADNGGNPGGASAATITALAATIEAQNNPPASDTPAASSTPENTSTPTSTPTVTLTPTPSVPTVTVSQTTNCRTGPGTQYDLVGAVQVGQSATVVGKYTAGNYLIINNLNAPGTCWLWGQYATVSGNIAGLLEELPPPTPTPSLPATPKKFKASVSCTSASLLFWNVHVVLTWTDMATNEDGYYLYRGSDLLATLGPDTTSFADDTGLPKLFKVGDPPPSVAYSIEAFNSAGKSNSQSLKASCP